VAKFKKLSAGSGPSEDLRQAIVAVLGIRVKYLAKHDSDVGPASGSGSPAPSPSPAPAPEAPRSTTTGSATPRAAAAAPVTEWVVAAIPSDDEAPPADDPEPPVSIAQFAVDDEPEDAAARALVATIAPPREGEVLPARDIAPSIPSEDEDEGDTDAATDVPVPPMIAPPMPTSARPAAGSSQRYGEAVVRQVLGARFVREEPYEPPTRFS
jgi:DNA polymerase-3 subunit gamma/tau